ncbi:hypothetical protein ACFC6L_11340 [Kitasatospora phosalacinea]|uniref:hypothetical protein n=1 Tax=Kitasatospora phosalacinea TaxID=2065 RepID=UPI0035DD0DB3
MARYDVMALDATGVVHGHRTDTVRPDAARMGAFGDEHGAPYVEVVHEDGQMVFGRDGGGRWHLLCDEVDRRAAEEVLLWFELLHHYPGPGRDDPDHPLAGEPPAGTRGELERTEALRLVAERIAATGADYPVDALVAERFPGGWSVYAPVEVDDSDPTAFLESLPVGRSVFLVGDLGRIREASTSLPPNVLRERFRAEEAFIRRVPEEESLRDEEAELWAAATEPPGGPASPATSYTVVNRPAETTLIKRAAGLLDPIVQQLAQLGPKGWESLTAVFSCTVGAEVAQLSFRRGNRETAVRVPEKLAILVRRQRHLAARTADGPWYRLLVEADAGLGFGGVMVDYDHGDEPLPAEHLLPAVHYREDLFAYPRPTVPDWLVRHLAADRPQPAPTPAPTPKPVPAATPAPKPQPQPQAPRVVLDSRRHRLHADTSRITYGQETLALDDIEWVCYSVARTVTHRFLWPSSHETTYAFGAGPSRKLNHLPFTVFGRNAQPPQEWTALVDLVQQHVEPRLLERYFERVAAGEAVLLGALRVDRDGVGAHVQGDRRGPRREIAWDELAPVRVENGAVWLYRTGERAETIQVPLGQANAVLLPALLPALARLFTGRPLR